MSEADATTPTTSRSGRVVKKSIKLLEMDEARPPVQRITLTSKNVAIASPLVSPNSTLAGKEGQANLKVRLSFQSGDFRIQPDLKDSIPIETMPRSTINFGGAIRQAKDDNIPNEPIKIVLNNGVANETPNKKAKLEIIQPTVKLEPSKTNTTTQPLVTILQVPKAAQSIQLTPQSSSDSPSQSLAKVVPPTITLTSNGQNHSKILKVSGTSMLSLQPQQQASSSIMRSIQEQKRINLANRQRLATSLVQPTPPPTRTVQYHQYSTPSMLASNAKRKPTPQTNGEKKGKRPSVSAYVLWCKDSRRVMRRTYPELDFACLSKKMGEIWHQLPQNEKATWFSKAKMIAEHGPSIVNDPTNECDSIYKLDHLDESMIPKVITHRITMPIVTESNKLYEDNFPQPNNLAKVMYEGEHHEIGLGFADLEAYFNILGDSLMSIGSYLKRGVRYNSDIDYTPQAALSTLLDTTLVACANLSALCNHVPELAIEERRVVRLMDTVVFFMPPNDLS